MINNTLNYEQRRTICFTTRVKLLKIDTLASSVAAHLLQYFDKDEIQYFMEALTSQVDIETLPENNDCLSQAREVPVATLLATSCK